MITIDQIQELSKIRDLAKKVDYYNNPFLDQRDTILFLAKVLPETRCLVLPEIIKKDLITYPVFTAISNWCDPETGIGKNYPAEVIRVCNSLTKRYTQE